jgi:hypothetical protein
LTGPVGTEEKRAKIRKSYAILHIPTQYAKLMLQASTIHASMKMAVFCVVVWYKFTDVSEVLAASIIRVMDEAVIFIFAFCYHNVDS